MLSKDKDLSQILKTSKARCDHYLHPKHCGVVAEGEASVFLGFSGYQASSKFSKGLHLKEVGEE